MLQLSREERLANARKKLKEFRSNQKQTEIPNEISTLNTYGDVVNTDFIMQNAYSDANGYSSSGQKQQQQYITPPYQRPPENVSNNIFTNEQPNVEQSGSSFSNGITTAATEKAAQISQEINHLLQSSLDYTQRNHSRTPSEATTTLTAPLEEGNRQETGDGDALRSTSHLSLPNSWEGNTRSSPSANQVIFIDVLHWLGHCLHERGGFGVMGMLTNFLFNHALPVPAPLRLTHNNGKD
ncbi:hypothetical protein ACTXT7_010749 [Hymenolepis weldensis]